MCIGRHHNSAGYSKGSKGCTMTQVQHNCSSSGTVTSIAVVRLYQVPDTSGTAAVLQLSSVDVFQYFHKNNVDLSG